MDPVASLTWWNNPHRLRAIGHPHGAENERQAWPELHGAIQAARKTYQQEGKTPDSAAMSNTIMAIHGAAPLPPPEPTTAGR